MSCRDFRFFIKHLLSFECMTGFHVFANTLKNYVFCCELAITHLTKELKTFVAFAESVPTSAALTRSRSLTRMMHQKDGDVM